MAKEKNNEIKTKSNATLSSIVLVVEVFVIIFLLMYAGLLSYNLGFVGYSAFNNEFDKHNYAQKLIEDEDTFIISDSNLAIINGGEVEDTEIILFYWLTNIENVVVLALLVNAMEKVRKFLSDNNIKNPFSDESLKMFKDVVKYFEIIIGVDIFLILIFIFCPLETDLIFDIGIFEIACVFFIYYLLRKGNEMLKIKEEKNA